MRDVGFDVVCEAMVVKVPNMNDTYVMLNHRPLNYPPLFSGDKSKTIDYNIHGHIHNSTPELRSQFKNSGELVEIPKFNINISVEVMNYEPQLLEDVVRKYINKQKAVVF